MEEVNMKKIIILLIMAAIIAPAFADVAVSGELKFGVINSFDAAEAIGQKADMKVNFTGKPDDFTTANVKMKSGFNITAVDKTVDPVVEEKGELTDYLVMIDAAYFETNLAGYLEMEDITIKLMVGYNDSGYTDKGKVSPLETEKIAGKFNDVKVKKNTSAPVVSLDAGVAEFTLRIATDFVNNKKNTMPNVVIGAFGSVAGVSYDAFYGLATANGDEGVIAAGASYGLPIGETMNLSIGVNLAKTMADVATNAKSLAYGVGTKLAVSGDIAATLGLGLSGSDAKDHAIDTLGVSAEIDPGIVKIEAQAQFTLYKDAETFNQFSIGIAKSVGSVTYGVGYMYYNDKRSSGLTIKDDKFNFAKNPVAGGLYLNATTKF
jgi:hypothetical protein